jgi:hypothetical protein
LTGRQSDNAAVSQILKCGRQPLALLRSLGPTGKRRRKCVPDGSAVQSPALADRKSTLEIVETRRI